MKQTAVEWMVEQLRMQTPLYTKDEIINQAKEMENQQKGYSEEYLEVAFFEGRENNLSFNEWFEQFKNKQDVTPKEKAKELVYKTFGCKKHYAKLAVYELIEHCNYDNKWFWQQVKQEIEKL